MKESLVLISFSALLFVSSGIFSQTTDKISTIATYDISDTPLSAFTSNTAATGVNDKNLLILAKVNNNDGRSHWLPSSNEKNKTEAIADTAETKNASTIAATKNFSDEEITHLRQLFLQAEKAIKKNDNANYFLLSDQLKDYPLYPYLQYQWLKKHLNDEKQIKHFLSQHKSSRYAYKLKRQWLHYLAKNKQWPLFLQFYSIGKEAKLNCYYHLALFNTGNKQAALNGAKDLWAVGRSQPRVCGPLFTQLKKSSFFTQELRWQRFDAALQNNKLSLASYVRSLMPKKYHATAQLWLNLHRNPSRYMPQLLKRPQSDLSTVMFRHAINRLASKNITKAIEIWDANKQRFPPDEKLAKKPAIDKLERRLALKLVFEHDSGAYERLSQLDEQDNSSRTWRVRIALSEQNWPNVLSAIHALNDDEKTRDKWQYWLARAYMETGEIAMAQALLSDLSMKRSFYGFLAADKVNNLYQLSDTPVNVSSEEIAELKNRKEFRVAFELMELDRKNKAKLQWWHASRPLNKNEILVAAKLAQQWQWDEIAIFTIAKAKYWDDIEVRFPLSYVDKIHENSAQHNLNPVILYGLIRRESAFNEKAHSPTGARGLMQIMPRTGKDIARHLNERWRGSNSLYNPITNLKYGSYYYQKLLTRFDGHYAIALAAYNAGPERVKRWLPDTETLPADIWIETIPYKETREYVTNVLAYALIYQQRAQSNAASINNLSMNDLTRDVLPLSATP
jgi:soluble lytic murein transglycosylase